MMYFIFCILAKLIQNFVILYGVYKYLLTKKFMIYSKFFD